MALKSPRRRSSPRPRRRYFTLNGFFRRTLTKSSSSRSNVKSNSNVSEEKEISYKNAKLEDDLVSISSNYQVKNEINEENNVKCSTSQSYRKCSNLELQNNSNTKIIFKTKRKSIPSDESSDNKIGLDRNEKFASKSKHDYITEKKKIKTNVNYNSPVYIKSESPSLNKVKSYNRRKDKKYETSTSYHSFTKNPPAYAYKVIYPGERRTLMNINTTYKPVIDRYRTETPLICYEDAINYQNVSKTDKVLDNKYIERLIRKQYKQKKLSNRNDQSEFSQYSAPICRDNIKKLSKIQEEYIDTYHNKYCNGESIYNTNRYTNKKILRNKRRNEYTDVYNNAELYDVIPVKEKSNTNYQHKEKTHLKYTDVPPSPKSHRPKLNLEPHYVPDTENYTHSLKNTNKNSQCLLNDDRGQPINIDETRCKQNYNESKSKPTNNIEKQYDSQNSPSTSSPNSDKTNNVLNEIKDVLHNFLIDIKRETSSHNEEKSYTTTKPEQIPNYFKDSTFSGNQFRSDFNQCAGPAFMPPYNPCYPAVPFYPMQSAYVIPSCTLTCTNCIHNAKNFTKRVASEPSIKSTKCCGINKNDDVTQEMIKKIYHCVTQKQNGTHLNGETSNDINNNDKYKRRKSKYTSRSCEAFGSKISESSVTTQGIMSDTKLLDRRSVNVTVANTSSQSIFSNDSVTTIQKKRLNKFQRVLHSLGLGKGNKKIKEYASEDNVNNTYIDKPYRQDVFNYNVHDQEFYNYSSAPDRNYDLQHHQRLLRPPRQVPKMGDYEYSDPHINAYHHPNYCNPYREGIPFKAAEMRPQMQSNNPYGCPPVCFKEIEVRSTATQSYTKNKSFFSAFRKKNNNPTGIDDQNHISTQTKVQSSWKKKQIDPINFTLKPNQRFAEGDMTMRNAILKKLFKKKNPFSPNNLLVKTLLGKDQAGYGEPKAFKTKMFF